METLGIAVVGAGYWGPNLIRNVQACDDAHLRWVCDLDHDRARSAVGRYSTVRTTARLDDVLDDPEVDAVLVATPPASHFTVGLACLEAGKHVLVEKPLAPSLDEGRKLVSRAQELGLTLMCDHTYCFTPAVQRIRELIHDGALGDVHFVDSVRINLGLVQADVDVFWDLLPHDLSILDFILPGGLQPLAVTAQGADPLGVGQSCIGYLTMPLPGDAIAHAHVNWLSPTKVRTMIVGGSDRTLVWDDLDPMERVRVYDRGVDLHGPLTSEVRRETRVSYRMGDIMAPALQEGEALRGVVSEFLACIREGRTPLTDGASGLRVLEVLEAASRSLASARAPVSTAR